MKNEKAKVYTRTGDKGTTSLVGGIRIDKNSARIEAYGTIDELSSNLGLVAADTATREADRQYLQSVQNDLFDIGSYLACDPGGDFTLSHGITPRKISEMEQQIDALNSMLPEIKSFVLPGGSELAARTHVARTVCRRAERRIITLARQADMDPEVIVYINRLSDYLFILARFNNIKSGNPEIFWKKNC